MVHLISLPSQRYSVSESINSILGWFTRSLALGQPNAERRSINSILGWFTFNITNATQFKGYRIEVSIPYWDGSRLPAQMITANLLLLVGVGINSILGWFTEKLKSEPGFREMCINSILGWFTAVEEIPEVVRSIYNMAYQFHIGMVHKLQDALTWADSQVTRVSIPYWDGSQLHQAHSEKWQNRGEAVSIPYWDGSPRYITIQTAPSKEVSIPYWDGSHEIL